MKLSCIHCGGAFTVRSDQLGTAVACPHCRAAVNLPKADDGSGEHEEEDARTEPASLLTNSISGMASLMIHTLALVLIALIPLYGGNSLPGESDAEVMIGIMPSETLSANPEESLDSASAVESETDAADTLEELDITPPTDTSDPSALESVALNPTSMSSGDGSSFDLGVASAGGGGEGGGWDNMLQRLRRNGLDVVIVFDSTGSMGGEIDQVKRQIRNIGTTLTKLVPKARISLVTYRDERDSYVVKDPIMPLTGNVQRVEEYLNSVRAGGGGDRPEAVHAGLAAAVEYNEFSNSARKVLLLFGDAPPHAAHMADCLRVASDFQRQNGGVVSTVTCRSQTRLKEFVEIAQIGGGEAFLTADKKQIMTQLMILVFGSRFRSKVVEAFELLER